MIFWQLFISFFKVGLLGFGGGLAIVRLIYDSIQPFLDMSQETFANIVAISQITPGPLAVNTATYVGYEAAGVGGSVAATFGVILPAFIIVSMVCRTIQKFRDSKIVNGALAGIRPATMGLIAAAAVGAADVVLVGTVQSKLGAGTDWAPADGATIMQPVGNGKYQLKGKLPKGNYEFKVAIGGSWNENYGAGGARDGGNISLKLAPDKLGDVELGLIVLDNLRGTQIRDNPGLELVHKGDVRVHLQLVVGLD